MEFSPIIVGVMRWGAWGANHGTKDVQKLIETSLNEGLTTFDHADIYGGYTTERLFGDAWKEMNIPRESVQLVSKCGIEYPGGAKPFTLKSYNYDKSYILKCVDESLANLQADYLDLLLLHRPSPLLNPEEVAAAFQILRSNGKVRDFGVSNFSVSQFSLMEKYFPQLVTNQVEISLTETKAFDDGTLDQMMLKNLRPMAWSVMGSYFGEKTEQQQRIKELMVELIEKYNAAENQLLLAFLLRHPAKILPVIGTSRAEAISELRRSLDINMEREDWFRLLEASLGRRVL